MTFGKLNKDATLLEQLKTRRHAILWLPQTTIYAHILSKGNHSVHVRELARSAQTGMYEEGEAHISADTISGFRYISPEEYAAAKKSNPFYAAYLGQRIMLDNQTGPRGGIVHELRNEGVMLKPFLFARPTDHKLEWRDTAAAYVSQSLLSHITPVTKEDLDGLIASYNKKVDEHAAKSC